MDAMKNSPSLQRLGQETQDLVRPSQEGAFKSTAATAASPQVAGRAGSKVEQEEENTAASAASPQVACRAELCSPPKGVEVPQHAVKNAWDAPTPELGEPAHRDVFAVGTSRHKATVAPGGGTGRNYVAAATPQLRSGSQGPISDTKGYVGQALSRCAMVKIGLLVVLAFSAVSCTHAQTYGYGIGKSTWAAPDPVKCYDFFTKYLPVVDSTGNCDDHECKIDGQVCNTQARVNLNDVKDFGIHAVRTDTIHRAHC